MNAKELFENLLTGKKMRDKEFCEDYYVYLDNNGNLANSDGTFVRGIPVNCDWEEYKEPILTDKEKEYLSNVIKPFKNKVECIYKKNALNRGKEWIVIGFDDDEANFPYFKTGTMYNGMEVNKEYTLKELGLE